MIFIRRVHGRDNLFFHKQETGFEDVRNIEQIEIDEDINEDDTNYIINADVDHEDFPYDGNKELNTMEILTRVHQGQFDISVSTQKFPLHLIEMRMNFNRICGFTPDYQNFDIYTYQFVPTTDLKPYLTLSMLIGPQSGFPIDKLFTYIPTDNISTGLNTGNPVIQGEFMLPDSQYPFEFITNLVPLELSKHQDPLLLGHKVTITNSMGIPTEIDVAMAQRYIQGTVRVALFKELEILGYIFKIINKTKNY